MSYSYVLAGYFGFGNVGDEAILSKMISKIYSINQEADIAVISGNPKNTKKTYRVESINWFDLQRIAFAIETADLVVIGGGGIFHDYWGVSESNILSDQHIGLESYSSIALIAEYFRKPLRIFAAGVGPLLSKSGKYWTKSIFNYAQLVSVRDNASAKRLKDIGIPVKKIQRIIDPVFNPKPSIENNKTNSSIHPKLSITISLRSWPLIKNWEQWVAYSLDNIAEELNTKMVFVPFQINAEKYLNDVEAAKSVVNKMRNIKNVEILREKTSADDLIKLINNSDLLIGMRLHSLIYAINGNIPFVGINYDEKIKNVIGELGFENQIVDLAKGNADLLTTRVLKTWKNRKTALETEKSKLRTMHEHSLHTSNAFFDLSSLPETSGRNNQIGFEKLLSILDAIRDGKSEAIFEKEKLLSSSLILKQEIKKLISDHEDETLQLHNLIAIDKDKQKFLQMHLSESIQKNISLEKRLTEKKSDNLHLAKKLSVAKNDRLKQKTRIENIQSEIQELSDFSKFQENELISVKSSKGYKVLIFLWAFRKRFFPEGTLIDKALRNIGNNTYKEKNTKAKKKSLLLPFDLLRRLIRHASFAYPFYVQKKSWNKKNTKNYKGLHLSSKKDLVSIVLPVYNGEMFLHEAIESIISQTYDNWELIIVNDGSTDKTQEIIDKYKKLDTRIVHLKQPNGSLPVALNNGFSLARGEYLTWTSHDNRLKPSFLENLIDHLRNHQDVDMVYANMDLIDTHGMFLNNSKLYEGYQQPLGSFHVTLPKRKLDRLALNNYPNNFIGGAFMYRDRVKFLIGDYSKFQFTREDYDYWMKVNAFFNIAHLRAKSSIYDYRVHSDSLTSQDDQLRITENREQLMIFDDSRRDFYSSKCLWMIESDNSKNGNSYADKLKTIVASTNNINLNSYNEAQHPKSIPLFYVKFVTNNREIEKSSPRLQKHSFNVLVTIDPADTEMFADEWDEVIKISEKEIQSNWIDHNCCRLFPFDGHTLFSIINIKGRINYVNLLETKAFSKKEPKFPLSIVICTYKRKIRLTKVLLSIADQNIDPGDYQVIIVNNDTEEKNFSDKLKKGLHRAKISPPKNMEIVDCFIPGLSSARNVGIGESQGEVILFVDDDITLSPNCLNEFLTAFNKNKNAGVVGGQIILQVPKNLGIPWKNSWKRYWSHFVSTKKQYSIVESWGKFPWGANWAARKKSLTAIGGFRTSFGRVRDNFMGGEEIVAAYQIKALGYDIAILPQAKVTHRVAKNRFTLQNLRKTIKAGYLVQYQAQVQLKYESGASFARNILRIFEKIWGLSKTIIFPRKNRLEIIEIFFQLIASLEILTIQIYDQLQKAKMIIATSF